MAIQPWAVPLLIATSLGAQAVAIDYRGRLRKAGIPVRSNPVGRALRICWIAGIIVLLVGLFIFWKTDDAKPQSSLDVLKYGTWRSGWAVTGWCMVAAPKIMECVWLRRCLSLGGPTRVNRP